MWKFHPIKPDRLDRLLREAPIPGKEWLTRASIESLIEQGRVVVNGRRVKKPGEQLAAGVEISLDLPALGLTAGSAPAPLLWADESRRLALFSKPAGLATYPLLPWENGTFANQVSAFLKGSGWMNEEEFAALAEPPRLEGGLLQRLDRDTSGIMAVALEPGTKEIFRAAFSEGKIRKTYRALVAGRPAEGKFRFKMKEVGAKVQAQLDPSGETDLALKLIFAGKDFSEVEILTRQGSRHVVRATLSALGHALAGDAAYGGDTRAAPFHQLHALALELLDLSLFPEFPSGIEAAPPQSFLDCRARLGIH